MLEDKIVLKWDTEDKIILILLIDLKYTMIIYKIEQEREKIEESINRFEIKL